MSKILIVIIVIVVLAVGGFGVYKLIGSGGEGGGDHGAGGSSSQILDEIRNNTDIVFSDQTTVVFGWSTAEDSETVFGSLFKAENVSANQASAIGDYLLSQSFQQNSLNTSGSYTGYKRGNLVCSVMSNGQKAEVSCGELPAN